MKKSTRSRGGRVFRVVFRRFLPVTGLGGSGLLLAGCAAFAAAGAGIVGGLLLGSFLGAVQASFAATARSYAFTDRGSAQWMFRRPPGNPNSNVDLSRFVGRLPGFYVLFISPGSKVNPRLQEQEQVMPQFTTDVEIDFDTSPPTLTGTIREVGGAQEFAITEVYPEVESISLNLLNGATASQYDVRLTANLRGVEGELLEYGFVWHAQLSSDGLNGDVDIVRTLTTAEGEEIVIEGSGSLSTTKQ